MITTKAITDYVTGTYLGIKLNCVQTLGDCVLEPIRGFQCIQVIHIRIIITIIVYQSLQVEDTFIMHCILVYSTI